MISRTSKPYVSTKEEKKFSNFLINIYNINFTTNLFF